MKKYVFPVPPFLRGKLLHYPRLYAYPTVPEKTNGTFIILDSGAFALAKQGRQITKKYMEQLNKHYTRYDTSDCFPSLAIAPDMYLQPDVSLRNYVYWVKKKYAPVVPVIQFGTKHRVPLQDVRYQMAVYKGKKIICVSNPALRAKLAKASGIEDVFKMLKKDYNVSWIHVLGAGWDKQDIFDWAQIQGFDSMDSIAYYSEDKKTALFRAHQIHHIFSKC